MSKVFIIGVISQKGGVGKTTVAINLAIALRMQNYRVLLVDGDTSNPTVGISLGMEEANIGYSDLITKHVKFSSSVAIHGASGLHVVLGTLHTKPFVVKKGQMMRLDKMFRKEKYDFIVVDTSPGYYTSNIFDYWDEGIVLATPDMPAVTSVLRLEQMFKKDKKKCALVLNRVRGKRYELREDEIEEAWGGKIVAELPEDDSVSAAVAERIPVFLASRKSAFALAISRLANRYTKGRGGLSRLFKLR